MNYSVQVPQISVSCVMMMAWWYRPKHVVTLSP